MSHYPPGMTREDWKHIDGVQHYKGCPQHEDNVALLGEEAWDCCCDEIAQALKDEATEHKADIKRENIREIGDS